MDGSGAQDSRKYTTGDAGDRERSSCIPGRDGEADTYFSYTKFDQQYVERTKIQERYLCRPRLEAPLFGRAESAVEVSRPGWLSQQHGVATLLRILKTHCAKHALSDMGSHLQAFTNKKKHKRNGAQLGYTMQKRVHQRTPDDAELQQPHNSPQEDHDWDWHEWSFVEVLEWDGLSLKMEPVHGPGDLELLE